MKLCICLVFALALAVPVYGKTFNRCSLARELSRLGVPRNQLARWTCIAQHESSYRTGIVRKRNTNFYGIFQISSQFWCKPSNGRTSPNKCQISCNQLLSSNIANSVRCARKILSEQGWSAWSTSKYCSGALPSINSCF